MNELDTKHSQKQKLLVRFGIGFVLLALILGAIAIGGGAFSLSHGGFPKAFLLLFLALPCLFVGTVCLMFGLMGKVARYQAGEVAPVAKDTINYMGRETQPGVKAFASALGEGLRGEADQRKPCPHCGGTSDADARFCDDCGKPFKEATPCPSCNTPNAADARFCDNCGTSIK